jgi:hypothetical protein
MGTFFSKLFGGKSRQATSRSLRHSPVRLEVEGLESRLVPANVTLTYHGSASTPGAVIPNVQVETVFYGPDWKDWANHTTLFNQSFQLNSFYRNLTNSSFMDMLSQYYQQNSDGSVTNVGRGSFVLGDYVTTGQTSGQVSDSTLQSALQTEIANGSVDAPDANKLYVIYLEPGVGWYKGSSFSTSTLNSAGYYGYHSQIPGSSGGAAINYAVLSYPGATASPGVFDTLTWHSTHEFAEAVTDPDLSTGWYYLNASNEVGDLANGITGRMNGYQVEYQWSNSDSGPALWTDNAHWVQRAAPNGTFTRTAVVRDSNGLEEMFGINTDGAIWYQLQDTPNGSWTGSWIYLGGIVNGNSQLAVGHEADGTINVFTTFTDNSVHMIQETLPGFFIGAQWNALGGYGVRSMVVGNDIGGAEVLFAIGDDHTVWGRSEYGPNSGEYQGWGGWADLSRNNGYTANKLALGHEANGMLSLFAIGTDGQTSYMDLGSHELTTAWYPRNNWENPVWNNLGGQALDIAVGINDFNDQEVFVIGTNHQVYHQYQTSPNGSFNGTFLSLGGWLSQIAVGEMYNNKLEVFGIGQNGGIYVIQEVPYSGDWHQNWVDLGGNATSLSVGYNQDGTRSLFTVGSDGNVYSASQGWSTFHW